jgi:hypothetical protein
VTDEQQATNTVHSKVTETVTTTQKQDAHGGTVTTTVRTVEYE